MEPLRLRGQPDSPRPRACRSGSRSQRTARTPTAEAVEQTLDVARYAAAEIASRAYVELLREPDLSVVVFRRIGWTPAQYYDWSERLRQANFAFVTPSTHGDETITRFAIVNPRTTKNDISTILDTLA